MTFKNTAALHRYEGFQEKSKKGNQGHKGQAIQKNQ